MCAGRPSMASRMMWLSALGTPAAGSSSSSTSGFKPERDRELDQALAAVGQLGDAVAGVVGELQGLEQMHRLVDHVPAPAGGPEHGRRGADALGHRDVDVLQHREPAEQPVDLERARDAELDACGLGDARDVAALEQHLARRGRDHAGQEIDERGLAGAVRADQRVARAGLQAKVDVARGGERAEVATEAAGLEQGRGHRSPSRMRAGPAQRSRSPPRAGRSPTTEHAVAREQRDDDEQQPQAELPCGRIDLRQKCESAM